MKQKGFEETKAFADGDSAAFFFFSLEEEHAFMIAFIFSQWQTLGHIIPLKWEKRETNLDISAVNFA